MNEQEVNGAILAITGNYAVVQVPSRNFPAVAIQGDSLKILQDTLKELSDSMDAGDLDDARSALDEITKTISEMISTYEDASRDVGFTLPYRG